MSLSRTLLVAALAATTLSACSKKDADDTVADTTPGAGTELQAPAVPRVTSMELGRAVDSTRNIMGGVTDDFGPNDTIYLAVRTENTAAGAMVTARWQTESGTTVDSTSQAVAPAVADGWSVTEFHIMRPQPWPTGKYRVEVYLDGVSQGIKDFEIGD